MKTPTLRYSRRVPQRLFCPRETCERLPLSPAFRRIVRHGFYRRRSDHARILRFRCLGCRSTFSQASFHPCIRQKKRQVNFPLWHVLASTVSKRRAALLLGVDRKTVDRKLRFLAEQARVLHPRLLEAYIREHGRLTSIQLDEMESFEHTKCKPVSIPLVVHPETRLILAVNACSMPAKGPLAQVAYRKYGPRRNERIPTLRITLKQAKRYVDPQVEIRSDSHPFYPRLVGEAFPQGSHDRVESRRSAVTGQGELKKVRWDPIFALNHTAAMLRANVSRLIRKTWCTTKRMDRLQDHLILYAVWHNKRRLEELDRKKGAA